MRRTTALLALLWAAGAVSAHAQVPWIPHFDQPRWAFDLALGPVVPGGSAGFNETSKTGFGYGIAAQRFIVPAWSLGLEILTTQFDGAGSLPVMPADGSFRVAGAGFRSFHLTTRLNLITRESWTPYVGAGIGFANGTSNILIGTAGGNQIDAVATQGASISSRFGLEFYVYRGLTLFTEARWVQYRLDAQSGGTATVAAAALGAVHARIGFRLWRDVRRDEE
jgi:hypothetical protein